MFKFIHQQNELENVLDLMNQTSVYGLDTEFIKVNTLWPKLGVLQINVNGQVFLLDGTTLDLNSFWTKIFKANQNIFHACGEDIDLIYHYSQQNHLENHNKSNQFLYLLELKVKQLLQSVSGL